jgi:hypothetical protein
MMPQRKLMKSKMLHKKKSIKLKQPVLNWPMMHRKKQVNLKMQPRRKLKK